VDLAGPCALGLAYDKSNLADGATLFLSSGRSPDSAHAVAITAFAPLEPHAIPKITKTRRNPSRQRKIYRKSSGGDHTVWLSSCAVWKSLGGKPVVVRSSARRTNSARRVSRGRCTGPTSRSGLIARSSDEFVKLPHILRVNGLQMGAQHVDLAKVGENQLHDIALVARTTRCKLEFDQAG